MKKRLLFFLLLMGLSLSTVQAKSGHDLPTNPETVNLTSLIAYSETNFTKKSSFRVKSI